MLCGPFHSEQVLKITLVHFVARTALTWADSLILRVLNVPLALIAKTFLTILCVCVCVSAGVGAGRDVSRKTQETHSMLKVPFKVT